MARITVRGRVDVRAVQQLERCAQEGDAPLAAMCADGHVGYSQPIGGAIAYREWVSPSGVGYDIGCGNKAVATNLLYGDIRADLPGIMDEVYRRISFGVGVPPKERVDHPVIERIHRDAPMRNVAQLAQKAAAQLGSVGSGNHYVDLFRDERTDRVWIGVHFGSRGFGHTIASGFLALAAGLSFDERVKDGEMDSPPVLLHKDSSLGYSYVRSMQLAGEYAYAGRDAVCEKVLDILGAVSVEEVHNHHNFAWEERHDGELLWVVRKGCTPAWPGQRGFVGATMGEPAVILEGVESELGPDLLYSTVHGAGRVMSRNEAAGKFKRRKWWRCRECGLASSDGSQPCPEHGHESMEKRWRTEQTKPGVIDFDAVRVDLAARGIELRGGGADEAPGAYKRLPEVLEAHAGTVRVLHTLIPVGVAMAGADVFDPFKD